MGNSDIIGVITTCNMLYENSLKYSLDPALYDDPDRTGYTNCSAWIRWLAREFAPDSEMAQIEYSYTGVMARHGEFVTSGTWNDIRGLEQAKAGDILLCTWMGHNDDYDHVELFLGYDNPTGSELWGAGYAPAPHKSGKLESMCRLASEWQLRRITWECANRYNMNHYQRAVKNLQAYLESMAYYSGVADGVIDEGYSQTVYALQRFLADRRYYKGDFDGLLDDGESLTIHALQRYLMDLDIYHVSIDGMIDHEGSFTMSAIERLEVGI